MRDSQSGSMKLGSQTEAQTTISIVMPLFNKEKEVCRAVQSVLNQTVRDFELLVVNDGSTDKGPHLVRKMNDPRIRLIEQRNSGVSAARNRGIEEARAEIVAFLDADDEWLPNFLFTINKLWSHYPHCSVFATNYLHRNVNGFLMPTILRGLPKAPWEGVLEDYFKVASHSDPPISSSAVAVVKEALASIGGFPVGVTTGEDLLTWARLASRYKIAYSTQPAAIFHLRESLRGRPTRIPDPIDTVGQELKKILKEEKHENVYGLKEFIAHWHQMRASVFLRLGKRKEAIYEVKEIARYSKKNFKLYLFFVIALLPQKIWNWGLRNTNYLEYYSRRRTIPKNIISVSR